MKNERFKNGILGLVCLYIFILMHRTENIYTIGNWVSQSGTIHQLGAFLANI